MTQIHPQPNPNPFSENLQLETFAPVLETPLLKQTTPEKGLPQWWQNLSLRRKAMIAVTLIGVVPVMLVGTIAHGVVNAQMNRDVKSKLQTQAFDLRSQLERFINDRASDIEMLAQQDIFTNPEISKISSRKDKDRRLNLYRNRFYFPNSISLTAIDLKGNVIAQSYGKSLATKDLPTYLKRFLDGQYPFISLTPSAKEKNFTLNIAVPINEQRTGRIIGLLRAQISMNVFNQLFDGILKEQKENFYLFDNKKNIVASNDKGDVGKNLSQEFPSLSTKLKQSSQGNFIITDHHSSQSSLVAYTTSAFLRENFNLDWNLGVVQPKEVAFAATQKLALSVLWGTLATAALVAVIAMLASEKATRSLRTMVGAVKKIGQGELDTRLLVKGQDELGVLGTNINAMAEQIQNLLQEQALSVEQANFLAQIVSEVIADRAAFESTLQSTIEKARTILQADRVVIYRFDAQAGDHIAYESLESGWVSALFMAVSDRCIPPSLLEAYKKGRIVPINDVAQAELHPSHQQLMERLQVRSSLIAPILDGGEVYGLLIAHHCNQIHPWKETEINFLKRLGQELSGILERATLQQQRREDEQRVQALKDLTLTIASALDTEEVFDLTVKELRQVIKSDRVLVYQFDENWYGTIIAESVAEPFPVALGAEIHDPCFAQRYVQQYQQGRVNATPNIYEAGLTQCHLKQLEPFQVKANLVAPILFKGQLLGLLIAHQCSGPRYWATPEINFFAQVATQVGFAIERTALLERQRLDQEEQRQAKEILQRRALELLIEVDPVSRGDLTIRAKVTEDEIGTIADSYNATIESLRRIVTQVQQATSQLANTTLYNEDAVRSLSQEAMSQAANVSQALERIQAITQSIRAVAANAEQAEGVVQQANLTVEMGEEAMNRTVDGIMSIRETVAETAKKVKRLGESSQKISKVVNLIGSFADQTNLLALNASIEAAHAGEEGRGFAVVADEVRSLARQSAAATAEIEALVASIQAETNEVVSAMEAGTEQVVMGTKLVDETRKSLNQITAASVQINELVEAIAKATVEQSQASLAVTQTMSEVAAISNKTSAEAAQVSDSFKQLLIIAQNLEESVRQFKVQ